MQAVAFHCSEVGQPVPPAFLRKGTGTYHSPCQSLREVTRDPASPSRRIGPSGGLSSRADLRKNLEGRSAEFFAPARATLTSSAIRCNGKKSWYLAHPLTFSTGHPHLATDLRKRHNMWCIVADPPVTAAHIESLFRIDDEVCTAHHGGRSHPTRTMMQGFGVSKPLSNDRAIDEACRSRPGMCDSVMRDGPRSKRSRNYEGAGYQAASAGQQIVESSGSSMSAYVEAEKPKAKKSQAAPGLSFPRFFTRCWCRSLDEVEWDLRSAVIGNERGEVGVRTARRRDSEFLVAGDQHRGLEMPAVRLARLSVSAASKQLIGRVVTTITEWARATTVLRQRRRPAGVQRRPEAHPGLPEGSLQQPGLVQLRFRESAAVLPPVSSIRCRTRWIRS